MLFISKLTSFLSFFFYFGRFANESIWDWFFDTKPNYIAKTHQFVIVMAWGKCVAFFFFVLIMDLNNKLAWGIHLIPHDMPNRFVQSIYTAHIQLVFSLVFVYSECFTWKLHLIFTLWMLFAYEMLSQASHRKFYWCWKKKFFMQTFIQNIWIF